MDVFGLVEKQDKLLRETQEAAAAVDLTWLTELVDEVEAEAAVQAMSDDEYYAYSARKAAAAADGVDADAGVVAGR